jgi:hypothetical protein
MIKTQVHAKDGDVTVERTQDCTPIAEWAKAKHNAGEFGSSELKLAARIPNIIVEKYCNDNNLFFSEVIQDPVHMRRIVQDPANSMFRIWSGKL